MTNNWQKIVAILSIALWVTAGVYGLIFNVSYIDEAKYLIKGWLMLNGEIGYYTTRDFFYQHMPGSLLWQGLGQKLLGPSLLIGRLQSFILGLLVLGSSWWLAKKLSGKTAALMTLVLLGLSPTVAFYYSTATPQSLLVLVLLLGFICLYDGLINRSKFKFLLASIWFSLTFIIRENFLFTLLLYIGFLLIVFRKKISSCFKHLLVIGITLSIFLLPGYPGTINVLKNLPGVSLLLPVSTSEKEILGLYWKEDLQTPGLNWRAIRDFGVVFHAWIIIGGLLFLHWLPKKHKLSLYWLFLVTVTGFNFVIHSLAAFKLSPRAIISYFPYVAPLIAVIMAKELTDWFKEVKNKKVILLSYIALLVLLPIAVRYGANFAIPTKWPDLRLIRQSGRILRPLVENKTKIVWIGEPVSLYMAGKVSYYPLINHINFYKPTDKTATVRDLGFWNIAMLGDWLNEADLVVVEDNKMKLLRESSQATALAEFIEDSLAAKYRLVWKTDDLWPKGLEFYQPLGRLKEQ